MKIIHTGDIHLGSPLRGLPTEKAKIRQAEIVDGFRRLCAYARENGVQAVLIAGDLFDEEQTLSSLRADVLTAVANAAPVCFFYVSGNHDANVFAGENLPQNLYLFSKNHGWHSYELPESVAVTGIDACNLREDGYAALRLLPDRFNIVMMHGDIARAQGADSVNLQQLQNRHIDYLALGHIHIPMMQAERLDGRGRYRYCGCLEGRGFDESGKRGFFLLEVQGGRLVNEQFLSLAKRDVALIRVDISACRSYYDVETAALSALSAVRKEDMVKLVLTGNHEAGLRKDLTLLSTRLSEQFFHVKVVDESRARIDYERYKNDLSERGEFVREVARYALSDKQRAEILDVGLKALAGEDIDL
ncbi:MAG: DNA repair exonuclease [Clostridiales bacterium]|nr:DNA repair exonuclease [Clostridiales bacterium]